MAQRHEFVVDLGTDAMTAKESVYLECKIECRASGRHSLYLALGGEDEDFGRDCHVNTESRGWKTFQIFRTFILVNIGWLFDACATATTAFYAMRAVFINFKISILTDGSLYKLGLVKRDWTILIVATIILFISSVMKEKGMSLRDFVAERPLVVRWAVYLILIFATAPFGYVSSSTEFMYAQF